ncbi:MAG: hypothetical protein IJN20_08460 [Oscillospiraceae bacterium]|nr:hypothetical protein [Oscillospiraceae bacterium]
MKPITDEEFFQKCKEEYVYNCISPADQARIALIGRRHNLTGTDSEIVEKFKAGKNAVESREKQKRIDEAREREQKILDKNTKYQNYSGRDKRIRMCYDKASYYRQWEQAYITKMGKINAHSYKAYRAAAQKEQNWGIVGGIAEGLAGPAAGVMAAMDAQRTNAEIREYNQKLGTMIADIAVSSILSYNKSANRYRVQAEEWEARLARAQTLLVQEYSKEQQKKMLYFMHPRVVDTTYSETGSIILEVLVKEGYESIYGNVNARVDGFFTAQLWQGDINVGEAMFGMNWNGSEFEQRLTGVCWMPNLDTKNQKITVTFEPYNLWAIEYRQ